MTKMHLFNAIYEGSMGSMAQAVRCARSDNPSLMPIGYNFEQNNMADIALPGNVDEEIIFGIARLHLVLCFSC